METSYTSNGFHITDSVWSLEVGESAEEVKTLLTCNCSSSTVNFQLA